ncbi:hypothetical protein C2845_PM15G04200 [Panicum miliaceum]|uniref:FBD domain-containing protein n=1 Tax=Panicum miliaceum TaxID=4540 RepID=A0A3L6Q7G4_PANMI|nr:hypothetical protein C2845_PM15G04200 [Panicum miliaceum]
MANAMNFDLTSYRDGGNYDGRRAGRRLFRDALANVLVDSYYQNDYLEDVMRTTPGMDALLAAPAVQRLEELQVELRSEFCQTGEEYVLPASRVPWRCLRVLDLYGCTLGPPAAAAVFGRLETLKMVFCWFEGEEYAVISKRRVLLRCPAATAAVTVIHCHWTDGLDIDAPGARSLRYTGFLEHFPFGPAAPPENLEHVQLSFCTARRCSKSNPPSSREAPPRAVFWESIGRFGRLQVLKLKLLDINDIAVRPKEEDVFLKPFPDLKFLELQGSYEVDSHGAAVAIAILLRCCPALQEFHLRCKLHGDWYGYPKRNLHLSDERKARLGLEKSMESLERLKSQKIMTSPSSSADDGDADLAALKACSFPCLESHLRKIRLEFELKCFDCFEVRLAKFLVENALVLEEMEVHDGDQRVPDHIHRNLPVWRANSSKSEIKIVGKYHKGSYRMVRVSNKNTIERDDEASSAPPRSPPSSLLNPFDDLDEGTRNLIRDLLREKDEARHNYSKETKKTSRLEAQLATAEDMAQTARAQLLASDSRVQALLGAAATATEAVNARGDAVAARLQDIPNGCRRSPVTESVVVPPLRLQWCRLYPGMIFGPYIQSSRKARHEKNLKTSSTT